MMPTVTLRLRLIVAVLAAILVTAALAGWQFAGQGGGNDSAPDSVPAECIALDEAFDNATTRLYELVQTDEVGTPEGQRLLVLMQDTNARSRALDCG